MKSNHNGSAPPARLKKCIALFLGLGFVASESLSAQELALPAPERLELHSKVLNENRTLWVRLPPDYHQSKAVYPVLYQTDAPWHVNETAGVIDFLAANDRMPQVILVAIGNTDRNRDLTPSHSQENDTNGVSVWPTSGGADKFLDFIQTELMPEIQRRYRTAPYRVFAGHSFGGLLAIHTLTSRPNLFDAYLAISPSLGYDNGYTLHQAQEFFATNTELKKALFFSLASEGNTTNPMSLNFAAIRQTLADRNPKGLLWDCVRYPDEDHSSTTLLAHYAGLKFIFSGWPVTPDDQTGLLGGGLEGVEQHYRQLSGRFGYTVSPLEKTLANLGLQLMNQKKHDDSVAVFQRNMALYPWSAHVYDNLGQVQEAKGDRAAAIQNFKKAIAVGKKSKDAAMLQYQQHLASAQHPKPVTP